MNRKAVTLSQVLLLSLIVSDNIDSTTSNRTKSPKVTDRPEDLVGICTVYLRARQLMRKTYILTRRRTYLAECCGGLKTCVRSKKLFMYWERNKPVNAADTHRYCCRGYQRDTNDPFLPGGNIKCSPVCDLPCISGECVAPNRCHCDIGLKKNPKNKYQCIPACTTPCRNAKCSAPSICICDPGYISKNGVECIPVCPGGCPNGVCVLPYQCKCHPGYIRDSVDYFTCKPECRNGCGTNGICIAPDTCKCQDGEKFSKEHQVCYSNQHQCNRNCGQGKCVLGDNRCQCNRGYIYDSSKDTCVPVCMKVCTHGTCVAPDKCQCSEGYRMEESDCVHKSVPFCNPPCGNFAFCNKSNQCECYEGYIQVDSTTCKPLCQNCEKGVGKCVAPGVCFCRGPNDMYKNDRCVEVTDRVLYQYYDAKRVGPRKLLLSPKRKCQKQYMGL